MNENEKKQHEAESEAEKAVETFFENLVLAMSFLPKDNYKSILNEIERRRGLVNAMEKIIIPATERRDFRAYSISKIIRGEANDER